jgi:hypothetical protein
MTSKRLKLLDLKIKKLLQKRPLERSRRERKPKLPRKQEIKK